MTSPLPSKYLWVFGNFSHWDWGSEIYHDDSGTPYREPDIDWILMFRPSDVIRTSFPFLDGSRPVHFDFAPVQRLVIQCHQQSLWLRQWSALERDISLHWFRKDTYVPNFRGLMCNMDLCNSYVQLYRAVRFVCPVDPKILWLSCTGTGTLKLYWYLASFSPKKDVCSFQLVNFLFAWNI